MLKSMSSVLMLVILCGGLQLSHGEKLKCEFKNISYFVVGDLYSCKVTYLYNSFDNMTIDGYTGVHMASKNDKDVKAIYIHDTNTKHIPEGLGSLSNLTAFLVQKSQLVEIKAINFLGMHNLEHLSLSSNNLTSVSSNIFSFLPKLKFLNLNYNQISEIPSGLFTNNLNLEQIHLYGNKIKFLSSGVFDGLSKLNNVDLRENICEINQEFEGIIKIEEMKNEMKSKCKNPNDPHEIIINLKEENKRLLNEKNAMAVELEALKNELAAAKKLQQKNEIEMNNLRDELQNTQLEKTKTQNINCEFRLVTFGSIGAIYSCAVRSLNNENSRIIINGFTGRHENNNKNVTDVKGISIYGNNIKYIPSNLGQLFNLTSFEMEGTNLRELKFMDFDGMQNLIYLNLGFNELTVIPSDGFRKLTQLKIINLNSNQLTELTNGIFYNNLNLERIYLEENKLKFIDADTFNGLTKLREVSLINNTCINEDYIRAKEVTRRLRNDLITYCFNRD